MRGCVWLCTEEAMLRRLYENPNVSWAEIVAAIPRHPRLAISRHASGMGLRRRRKSKQPKDGVLAALWQRRVELNMTRADLAEHTGYHKVQIARWERGEDHPRFRALMDWAQSLGLEITVAPRSQNANPQEREA